MSNSTKSFEEIVRAMSAKDIIMAMVNGLKNPSTKINMCTFGYSKHNFFTFGFGLKPICHGCAATNAICQIAGIKFTPDNIAETYTRATAINSSITFLNVFERAIDELRKGNIQQYNFLAIRGKFDEIKNVTQIYLPRLEDNFSKKQLKVYEELANLQFLHDDFKERGSTTEPSESDLLNFKGIK